MTILLRRLHTMTLEGRISSPETIETSAQNEIIFYLLLTELDNFFFVSNEI